MRSRQFGLARRAFVDSAAFFALIDPGDSNYAAARSIQRRLVAERWVLATSNFVVAETHGLILRRLGRRLAAGYLDSLDESPTSVLRVSEVDERRAREIIVRYDDKDFSLTDSTSFAVMERLRIPHAFTFDRHFEQFGFSSVESTIR